MLKGKFWDLIDVGASYEDVEQALVELVAPFGVKVVSCLELRSTSSQASPFIGRMFGKRDGEYLTRYRKLELIKHDVVAQHVGKTDLAFYWDDVSHLAITREQKDVFAIAAEHGFKDGLLSPFYGMHGRIGFTGFWGEDIDKDPATRRFLDACGAALYRYAYRKGASEEPGYPASPTVANAVELTERQREVLYWVSKGKTDWEMSRLLKIAEPTVNRHVELAKQRIGVRTRAEAVHYALMHQLIQPF